MEQIEQPIEQPTASVKSPAVNVIRAVVIFVLLFAVTTLAVRCVAVASDSAHGPGSAHPSGLSAARSGPALSIEQLAAKAGCQPKVQLNAAELRQGYCTTSSGRFFMTTFTSARGQQEWFEEAKDYGAVLLGNRWAIGAAPQVLKQLQDRLGGEISGGHHAS
jgi:hypothetical protein